LLVKIICTRYNPIQAMLLRNTLEQWLAGRATETIQREQPLVIAITGTVGKSTTKRAIAALLNADDSIISKTRVSPKSYNNELGVALTIFGFEAPGRSLIAWLKLVWTAWIVSHGWRTTGIRTFVLEMGADHPGDLARLVKIAPPNIAVITAVTPEGDAIAPVHLANYSSVEALAQEKATLVKVLKPDGAAILNMDDSRVFAMRHLTAAHVMTFGDVDGADVRIVSTRVMMEEGEHGRMPTGLEIQLESLNRLRTLHIPGVFGTSVAFAVAAAAALGAALDLGMEAVQEIATHFDPLPGRARTIPGIHFTTLLDDTYNASPPAVLSAIRDLATMPLIESQRRVVCLGEMRELGDQSQAMHRLVGAEAAKQGIDFFVACGTFARVMVEGALANGMREDRIKMFDDTPEAAEFLREWIRPGDVILAKASEGRIDSKGVRMERVIKALMLEPQRASELLVRQEVAWKRK